MTTVSHIVLHGLAFATRTPFYRIRIVQRVVDKFAGNPREAERFFKFAIVGTIGAVVDFTVLNLLVLGLGVEKVPANAVSFTMAVLSNFTWNRLWTFPESRKRQKRRQLPQFALVNLVGLGINTAVFWSLDHFIFTPMFGLLGYNLAKAVAILVVLFWNYIVNRLWTYKGL